MVVEKMPWFFCDIPVDSNTYVITDDDAKHISKSLRMKIGEELTLCSMYKIQYECKISEISPDYVKVDVISSSPCENEPSVKVVLFQAMTKGDKMDFIIQKAVELGASEVVPIMTSRCVSRPDEKTAEKKILRYQKIADNAARQSRRGIIPSVTPLQSFEQAIEYSKSLQSRLLFYEGGGQSVSSIIDDKTKSIGVFIGSEGGFSHDEVQQFESNGGVTATLGKRILRAETAPLAALSIIMYQTGNFE